MERAENFGRPARGLGPMTLRPQTALAIVAVAWTQRTRNFDVVEGTHVRGPYYSGLGRTVKKITEQLVQWKRSQAMDFDPELDIRQGETAYQARLDLISQGRAENNPVNPSELTVEDVEQFAIQRGWRRPSTLDPNHFERPLDIQDPTSDGYDEFMRRAQANPPDDDDISPGDGGATGDGDVQAAPPAPSRGGVLSEAIDIASSDPLSIPLAELDAQLAKTGDTILRAQPITSAAQAAAYAEQGGLNVMQLMNDEVAARRGEKTGGGFSLLESARVALNRVSDVGSEMSRWIRSAAESGWLKPEGKVAEWFDAVVPRARRMIEAEAVR